MATAQVELGPNNVVRLGVVCGVMGIVITCTWMAANANAKIGAVQATLDADREWRSRIETKVDELGDKLDTSQRETFSRLATLEAQMRMVQSAQPK